MIRFFMIFVLWFALMSPLMAFELQPGERYIGTYTIVKIVWTAYYAELDETPPSMYTTFFMNDGSKYTYTGTLSRPSQRVDLFLGQHGRIFMRPHAGTVGEKLESTNE